MTASAFSPANDQDRQLLRVLTEDNPERLRLLTQHLGVPPVDYLIVGDDLLSHAIRSHARNCIPVLFEIGFSMNRPSPKEGKHPLEEAMDARSPLVLEYLLDYGADPASPHSLYGTIMQAAAVTRTIDSLLPILCAKGGNPNQPSPLDGTMPLHAAVAHGETHNVEQLLALGADVNAVDLYGRTPIQTALARLEDDCETMATLLLDRGADPLIADFGGLNTLDLAAVRGEPGLIALLRQRTDWPALLAPPELVSLSGAPRPSEVFRKMLRSAVDNGDQRLLRDLFVIEGLPWEPMRTLAESPLLAALAKRRLDLAAPLIARGLGVEDTDEEGRNAVFYVLMATRDLARLKPFLHALHRLAPGLFTARDQYGRVPAVAAMHRGAFEDPAAIGSLLDEIRRGEGQGQGRSAIPEAEAERRRRLRLARQDGAKAIAA